MPFESFKVTQSDNFTAQPSGLGEKLIIRSTNAADVDPLSLIFAGTVGGSPGAEALLFNALDGRIETQSANSYSALTTMRTGSAPGGTVGVYGQGTKASGYVSLPSGAPTAGGTVSIGLNGFEKTYTWRAGASWTVVCGNVASLSQGDYFDVVFGGVTNRFWYDIDAAGTGAPADPGTLTMVSITTGGTASDVASATQAAIDALTNIVATVNTATVTVAAEALGTMTLTDGSAATGFTLTSVVTGTAATGDGDVVIGTDRFQTIRNLAHAINALTDSGTYYGSATTANPYGTAYDTGAWADTTFDGTSQHTIYLRDNLACSRYVPWVAEASDTDFAVAAPSGGADGVLLAVLDASTQTVSLSMDFNNPTLADDLGGGIGLLLARSTPSTDWIYAAGHDSVIIVIADVYAEDVVFDIEVSEDGVNARSAGLTSDPANGNTQEFWVGPAEYWRLVFSSNDNDVDVPIYAGNVHP